ncbi:thyroid transcription factor 1-associated protein 26 [Protopterus annectens]|uniref:thyroid transcription factor 1-associated protein 26 n=1 Tax=Protopterus annectens TaxID=7888 RepID=UPI001CFA721C|nr:thyroid transcription factor 1-associated protein 26 [Protopterus annectens]
MAPVSKDGGTKERTPKHRFQRRKLGKAHGVTPRVLKKKWKSDAASSFPGSVKEGKGFAIWRKQKILQDYKKLLRKQRKSCKQQEVNYTENYPEHLKHLYLAEEEKLKQINNKKLNRKPFLDDKPNATKEEQSNNAKEKNRRKTSNQKAKEEYENIQVKRAQKRKEAEVKRQQREEAIRQYKERKAESYKVLSKKTKKGQPNLNVQMEYLLQKIQQNQTLGKI